MLSFRVAGIWETHFEEKTLNYQSIKANGWLAGSGGENCSWQLPFEGQLDQNQASRPAATAALALATITLYVELELQHIYVKRKSWVCRFKFSYSCHHYQSQDI